MIPRQARSQCCLITLIGKLDYGLGQWSAVILKHVIGYFGMGTVDRLSLTSRFIIKIA